MSSSMAPRKRIAHVSTFPPLKCGVASFVSDLISATANFEHRCYILHYGSQKSSKWILGHADVNSPNALVDLAHLISTSDCDVVSLQHEFGIWGGREGENIHRFLDNLSKPLLSMLHTTFGPGVRTQVQRDILVRLIEQSAKAVVLTEASKETTESLASRSIEHMVVVPHGIHAFPYASPPTAWGKADHADIQPLRLISLGFFREDKGFEATLHAISDLRDRGYNISYRIAGEPQQQFNGQTAYRARVEGLIESLGLASSVEIDGRYLSVGEQAIAIQQAHLGIFAYQEPAQASSGTVPLVMSMGRPVLCTPFEYAKAKAQEGPGVFLAADFDAASIAGALERFMKTDDYAAIAKAVYDRTRPWTWGSVGKAFEQLYLDCR